MKRLFALLAAGALLLAAGLYLGLGQFPNNLVSGESAVAEAQASDELSVDVARSVVVELFTSQGCYSCPPADALLGKLAEHPSVLALSFHVDYWDYIGWKDVFASPEYTKRQREYARELSLRYVYTPQMIIDGNADVVGSKQSQVVEAIETASRQGERVAVRYIAEPSHSSLNSGTVVIDSGAPPVDGDATVWLAIFDDEHKVDIASGENAGKQLSYHNVVRELRKIGSWNGERLEIKLDLDIAQEQGRDGCAILVQEHGSGRILGAVKMDLEPT